jgi:hypothetical protein
MTACCTASPSVSPASGLTPWWRTTTGRLRPTPPLRRRVAHPPQRRVPSPWRREGDAIHARACTRGIILRGWSGVCPICRSTPVRHRGFVQSSVAGGQNDETIPPAAEPPWRVIVGVGRGRSSPSVLLCSLAPVRQARPATGMTGLKSPDRAFEQPRVVADAIHDVVDRARRAGPAGSRGPTAAVSGVRQRAGPVGLGPTRRPTDQPRRHSPSRDQARRADRVDVRQPGPGESGVDAVRGAGAQLDGGVGDGSTWSAGIPRGTNNSSPVRGFTNEASETAFWQGVSIPTTNSESPGVSTQDRRAGSPLPRRFV